MQSGYTRYGNPTTEQQNRNANISGESLGSVFNIACKPYIIGRRKRKAKKMEEKMNKSMVKTAKELFSILNKYNKQFRRVNGDNCGFTWIKNNDTGEVIAYAVDTKTLKELVALVPNAVR